MTILGIATETWFPVLTLVLGILLKGIFDYLSDRRLHSREQDDREDRRRNDYLLKSNEFQRQSLLDLQVELLGLLRHTAQIELEDLKISRRTGAWGRDQLPDGISDSYREAVAAVIFLTSRIRDTEIKRMVKQLRTLSTAVILAKDEQEAELNMRLITEASEPVQSIIGDAILALDEYRPHKPAC